MWGGRLCLHSVSLSISGASAGLWCSISPPGCHAERVQPDWRDTRRRRRNSCCCCDLWQVVEVGAIRRSRIKARMRALAVVKRQVTADRSLGFCNTVVGPKVDLFVFDRAPNPLDEDVVAPGAFAVPADRNGVVPQQTGDRDAGELGGFKWSSQHPLKGSCDAGSKAAVGSVGAGAPILTWSPAGYRTR